MARFGDQRKGRRTLLLTFFYRQMKDIIEKGYMYIAQPPLYRIKKGKSEVYVSSEGELNRHLLKKAIEEKSVRLGGDADREINGETLQGFLEKITQLEQHRALLARKGYGGPLLDAILREGIRERAGFEDKARLEVLSQKLRAAGWQTDPVSHDEEHSLWELPVHSRLKGFGRLRVNLALVNAPEFVRLWYLHGELEGNDRPPFKVAENGREASLATKEELLQYMLGSGKKGVHIQRYKGLGEYDRLTSHANHPKPVVHQHFDSPVKIRSPSGHRQGSR